MTNAEPTLRRSARRRCPPIACRVGAWLCWLAPMTLPAQALQRELPVPQEFVTGQEDNLFSLARSQEDIHRFATALAELAAGEHVAAAERLHLLLQNETQGVVPVAPGRFLGLRLCVVLTLANLPPAAKVAYEAVVRREASALLARPLQTLTEDQLRLLANRYPAADAGRSARLRLGDLALEAGNPTAAQEHFRLALDAAPFGSKLEEVLAERLRTASVVAQPRPHRTAPATAPAVADLLAILPPGNDPGGWPAIGGGDGATPMFPPAGRPEPQWSEDIYAPGFDRREAGAFAMHATGDLDGIYVNNGIELIAFDPLRRQIAWVSPSPLKDQQDSWSAPQAYENAVNQDMVLAAACGPDVVVAALQVPERSTTVTFQNHFQIMTKIPERRLFAFERSTGKLLWAHFDQLDGPVTRRFRGHSASGPPLILGDTVYAPVHDHSGAIAFSVGAYDLRTGQPRWRRLVCSSQQDVNMFGNARTEFAASPLCAHEGLLFGAANLGVCYAIELATGRLRWISAYEVVRMPETRLHSQMDRPVFFANSAPAVRDGVLCCTPLDSQYALGVDIENGRPLWRLSAEASLAGTSNEVRWLCGAFGDEFVLAGRGVLAVKARPLDSNNLRPTVRQLVRPEALRDRGDLAPRPALTPTQVFFPSAGRLSVFDQKGNFAATPEIALPRRLFGNLLLVDGIVVSLRQRSLDVLFDAAAMQQAAEARLGSNPEDPAAYLRLATLRTALLGARADAETERAITALYRRGLQAAQRQGLPTSHPVRRALQGELFRLALAAAQRAMQSDPEQAIPLLAAARDAAPDTAAALRAQTLLLGLVDDRPTLLRAELQRLEQLAGDATWSFPDAGSVPVGAYVTWRLARLPDQPPAAAVAAWQTLLERFPSVTLAQRPAHELAQQAIAQLIEQHGPAVYADSNARAERLLQQAGNDADQLRGLAARFPNSTAAATARTRLLDAAVTRGDLLVATEVLAHALAAGEPTPGILRRVLVAAEQRGNLALARAMADRLAAVADTVSDWPADDGASYGAVLARLGPKLAQPAVAELPNLPADILARIPARGPRERFSLLPTTLADGFAPRADRPLYAVQNGQLLAIDLAATGERKPVLFQQPINFLDHLVLCGDTLVIPDLTRIAAVDYRTGQLRWELPNPTGRLYECLSVLAGVLHLSAQSGDLGEGADFLGVEPLSGRPLFVRPLANDRMKPVPKASGRQLLLLETPSSGDPLVHRLDPITGRTTASVRLAAELLQQRLGLPANALRDAGVFPQGICADDDLVYLPIDSSMSGGPIRVAAIDANGALVFRFESQGRRQLLMAALRGDRLVLVEGSEDRGGRVVLLDRHAGAVVRELPLGDRIDILNWQRSWRPTPAPAALLLADVGRDGGAVERRFTCFPIDDDQPSFRLPLAADDGDCERQPLFGQDLAGNAFVAFGTRSPRGGGCKLYALRLPDRTAALPDGTRYRRLPTTDLFGVQSVGPYTVVSTADGLMVLGEGKVGR